MSRSPQQDVTQVLTAVSAGEHGAVDELFPVVYDELRALAGHYLRRERCDHTLQTTALVHEAYLKLVNQHEAKWRDRAHFFAIAAQAIRRVLVDHARTRKRRKRGGGRGEVSLSIATPIFHDHDVNLEALDEALDRLEKSTPLEARIVELRFFAELTEQEIAEVLGISDRTVRRHWNYAKAWLFREIKKGDTRAQAGR